MSMITPITIEGFPQYARPWNNITPFTYRDGMTYLEVLEGMRLWLKNSLIPHVNTEMVEIGEAWNAEVLALVAEIESALSAHDANVDSAISDANASFEVIKADINARADEWLLSQIDSSDTIVSTNIDNPDSLVANAISAKFDVITSRDYGITSDLTPAARAKRIQELWNDAASTGKTAIMLPGEYEIDIFPERTRSDGILTVPANSHIIFQEGCYLKRTPFIEETQVTFSRVLIIGEQSNNSTLEGTVKVTGAGSSVTWYNEHNHCVFIYNAVNVNARNLHIISDDAMGDCLSFSGGGNNQAIVTENVFIGSVDLRAARRKSLVVEATVACGIDRAYINNTGPGGAFDYEPFNIESAGRVLSFYLGNLHVNGNIDLTAGTNTNIKLATITGNTWHIISKSGNTASPYFSYGVNIKLNSLYIDMRLASPDVASCSIAHTSLFNVKTVEIIVPNTYAKDALSITTTTSGAPALDVGTVTLSGSGKLAALISCVGRIGEIRIEGAMSGETRLQISAGEIRSGVNAFAAELNINTLHLVNAYNVEHLIDQHVPSSTIQRHARIGIISVVQSDGRVSGSLVRIATAANLGRLYINDIGAPLTAFNALISLQPGAIAYVRHTSNPEKATYYGTSTTWTPESVITARAGSMILSPINAKLFFKTTDDTVNTGWINIAA